MRIHHVVNAILAVLVANHVGLLVACGSAEHVEPTDAGEDAAPFDALPPPPPCATYDLPMQRLPPETPVFPYACPSLDDECAITPSAGPVAACCNQKPGEPCAAPVPSCVPMRGSITVRPDGGFPLAWCCPEMCK